MSVSSNFAKMSLQEVLTFFRKLLLAICLFTIPSLYKRRFKYFGSINLNKNREWFIDGCVMETIIKWMGMFLTSE